VAGQADAAGILPPETSTMLQLQSEGKIGVLYSPTISTFFMPFDLNFNATTEPTIPDPVGTINVAHDFFASNTVREFLVHAWPYATINNTLWTIDGVSYDFNTGGAIPRGMGNYFPTNISWPYLGGDPGTNTSVGSAAWWWTHGTTSGDPNFDAELAACTVGTPCKFPVIGELGAPTLDSAIADFITSIESLTGNAVMPYTFDLSFPALVQYSGQSPGSNPMPFYNLGWAPDYPDPTDYMAAMYYANGTYTLGDSTYQTLIAESAYNSVSCGHASGSFSDLAYWANLGPIPNDCQGVAYGAMLTWMGTASGLPVSNERYLIYNEVEHIENQLALYLWFEQANGVATYAKWINPSTININVMIGGGGDQTWYLWSYANSVSTVNFNETGLTAGTSWSVNYAGVTYTSTTATIAIAGQTAGSYLYTVGYVGGYTTSTATNGTVTVVPPTANSVSVTFASFVGGSALSFVESGLQSGASWTVEVSGVGAISGNSSTATFTIPTGTYVYTVHTSIGYTSVPTNGSVVLGGTGATVGVTFTGVLFETFPVTLTSTGLGGASWTVKIGNFANTTTSVSMIFWEPNGTYAFTVSTATLTPISPTGQANVAGAPLSILVPFTASPNVLTFTESGLATGVAWSVEILNSSGTVYNFVVQSTGTTVAFNLATGDYNFSVLPVAGWLASANVTGDVAVSAATGVNVPFTLVTYVLTIFEVGLITGLTWHVNATYTYPGSSVTNSVTKTAHTATTSVKVPSSTVTVTFTGPAQYTASSISVVVSGGPAAGVAVFVYAAPTFAVTFSQSGLPSGDIWNVSVNGISLGGSGGTLSTTLANGSYTYAVLVPTGLAATPSGGTVIVSGTSSVSITVAPSGVTPPPPAKGGGIDSTTGLSTLAYALIVVFVILALIFLATTLMARRRPPAPGAPQTWSPGQTTTTTTETSGDATPPQAQP